MEDFQDCLDLLDSLISFYGSSSDVILLGDFNADLECGGPWASTPVNEQDWNLRQYLDVWDFIFYHPHLNGSIDNHTYESEAHGSISCIDHVIGPHYFLLSILSCCIIASDNSLNLSDHPVVDCMTVHMGSCICHGNGVIPSQHAQHTAWNKLSS